MNGPQAGSPRLIAGLGAALVAAGVVAAGVLFARAAHVQPSFDAFGWLVWGRRTLHGGLNTSAAPSWKALPYLFTLPYALLGRTQLALWRDTATIAAIVGWVIAGRLAFRLTRDPAAVPSPWRDIPAVLAGVAAIGVVPLMYGMWHQILIADSDPMVVTLCLAAIDAGLSGRRRLTLALLVLATLGRPEALPFVVLYAGWMLARRRRDWPVVLAAFVAVPVGLFLAPALTSRSWFIAGDLAEGFRTAITHGSRIGTVLYRFGSLYPPAVWVAAPAGLIVAAFVRAVRWLVLGGAVMLWVVVEIAFAYHGWPAAPRYLMEPGAVCGVLAAATLGRALRVAVSGVSGPGPGGPGASTRDRDAVRGSAAATPIPAAVTRTTAVVVRGAALVAVAVLALTLVPAGRARAGALRHDLVHQRAVSLRIAALPQAIDAAGGAERIVRCAPPLSFVGNQSLIAWYLTLNVGDVAYKWKQFVRHGLPAVFIRPHGSRWSIRAINIPVAARSRCRGISIELNRAQRIARSRAGRERRGRARRRARAHHRAQKHAPHRGRLN